MTNHTPRAAQPRRWASLALTSATLLTAAAPAFGGSVSLPQPPAPHALPLTLIQESGEGGEAAATTETTAPATEGGEGGEGGEAGSTASGDATVDFLAGLLQIDGHLTTAFALVEAGHAEHGFDHLAHPLAEVYESLEHELEELGQPQFEELLEDLVAEAQAGADTAALQARHAEITARTEAAWQAAAADEPADAFAAIRHLILKAGDEWSEGVAQGQIAELHEYQDAWGFIQAARARATALAASPDAKVAAAAQATVAALDTLTQALPEVLPTGAITGDPSLFAAAAATVELAAYKVK